MFIVAERTLKTVMSIFFDTMLDIIFYFILHGDSKYFVQNSIMVGEKNKKY